MRMNAGILAGCVLMLWTTVMAEGSGVSVSGLRDIAARVVEHSYGLRAAGAGQRGMCRRLAEFYGQSDLVHRTKISERRHGIIQIYERQFEADAEPQTGPRGLAAPVAGPESQQLEGVEADGADEVVVWDGHDGSRTLSIDEIHSVRMTAGIVMRAVFR